MAIRSIKHKGLRGLYEDDDRRGARADHADKLRDMLQALDAAVTVDEVARVPGWRLHPLKGGLRGFWSVTVRANWRIIFRFEGADAFDVELIDYH